MANLLKGKAVADALTERIRTKVRDLQEQGTQPCLAIVRVGEKPEDLSYERGALKRAEKVGVRVEQVLLEPSVSQEVLEAQIERINADRNIHGILLFRPLPDQIDEKRICSVLNPEKDIDGVTESSLAGIFTGEIRGFPPCTARACMEMMHHYDIAVKGKKAVVLGRSLVIGKPAAMLLMKEDATVTICHSRTGEETMRDICRSADIVVAAIGKAKTVDRTYFTTGQTVLDVGINVDAQGNLCGDVDFEQVEALVKNITPVPGGIGAVTTAVLMLQTVEAAEQIIKKRG